MSGWEIHHSRQLTVRQKHHSLMRRTTWYEFILTTAEVKRAMSLFFHSLPPLEVLELCLSAVSVSPPPCQSVYVVFHMYFKQYPHRKWLDDQRPQKVNDILWLQATMLKAGPKISFLNLKVSNLRHYEKKLIFQLFQYLFIWSLLSSQFLDLDNFFIF